MILLLDLETRSKLDPKTVGAYKYAENAEVLLWGYAIDLEPAKVWDVASGEPMPDDLKRAWELVCDQDDTKARVVMHNGMMFDRLVLRAQGFGTIPPAKVIDTMVLAYESALPGKLAELCEVLQLPSDKAKDKDGERLIKLFCKPNKKGSFGCREENAEDWGKFVNYCRMDVESMREVLMRLPIWNLTPQEAEYSAIDATINDRGICVDIELAQAAVRIGAEVKERLARKMAELTNGQVQKATQTLALANYITDTCGYPIDSVDKQSVEAAFADQYLPEQARRILENRVAMGRSSAKKYEVLLQSVNSDNRLRGTLQFRGASRTGRFSGRRFQGQNLPRPTMSNDEIEAAIELCKSDMLTHFYPGKELDVLANLLRGVIVAPEGKKLVVADYSNVEGRVLAWLAGEDWKIKAFADFDVGKGYDLYKLAYSRAFNVKPEDVTKKQRQVGKVLELALGYGGGSSAFATFAGTYGIDLHDMADGVKAVVTCTDWDTAHQWALRMQAEGSLGELDLLSFTACEVVKRAWRKSNSRIVKFWGDLEVAFRAALKSKSKTPIPCGRLSVSYVRGYVRVKLPSGRYISYPEAHFKDGDQEGELLYKAYRNALPRWYDCKTWGGKLVENATQAVSCDLLCNALANLEKNGYQTVLTIHDEALCEVPDNIGYSVEKMEALMTELPNWAKGLPLAAAGFEAKRYRKD